MFVLFGFIGFGIVVLIRWGAGWDPILLSEPIVLVSGLVARGHDVALFAAAGPTSPASSVRHFPKAAEPESFDHRELVHVALALGECRDCDVVHNHCLSAGPALGGIAGRPFVSTFHYLHPIVRAFPEGPYVAVSESQR